MARTGETAGRGESDGSTAGAWLRARLEDGAMTSSLLTAAEVAEQLGVPISWVYEQSRRGLIPTVTLGRYRRYRREAIERWVEDLEGGFGGRDRLSRAFMEHEHRAGERRPGRGLHTA